MLLVPVLALLMVGQGYAQMRGNGCRGNRANMANRANRVHTFDVQKPLMIEGKITSLDKSSNKAGRYGTGGIHLVVAADGKNVPVRLGPAVYLESNDWNFNVGDSVKVKAFKGTGNADGLFFAAEITRGGKQLVLRDANGFPQWRRSMAKGNFGRGQGRNRRGY